jgi:hypothetical protein
MAAFGPVSAVRSSQNRMVANFAHRAMSRRSISHSGFLKAVTGGHNTEWETNPAAAPGPRRQRKRCWRLLHLQSMPLNNRLIFKHGINYAYLCAPGGQGE